MICTSDMLKAALPPERYYSANLSGSFGKPTGDNWHMWDGLCPFHDDKRAGSLVVNKTTGAFKCFSCGESGGDIIDFQMKITGVSFKTAFNQLQEAAKCAR